MMRPAESQIIVIVFSVRTSSSVFSSVHDRREQPVDWIDIPLKIFGESTITLPGQVPAELRKSLIRVLNGYEEVLSVHDNDIALTNVIEHAILTGDHPPISCAPYRYSPAQRAAASQRIKEFEANGWIEPAIGPWSFPVVIVPKKAGGIQICIDYRKLNDITIKDVYPLPRIDELLDAIGSARFFSKFDVRHGFHHLLVREEDRPKITFVLFEGTWQWIRCPMGICNAPATFQRAMNMAFQNFVRKTRLAQSIINYCVIVYMDDILVYSSSYEGHVQHIEWALHALRDAGSKVALEKCQFFLTTISFLGHVVADKGLQPELQKVAAVRDAPVPTTITQVRAFLGLASYYRRFIKSFAVIAGPLTNLLRKDQPLIWTSECDQAFSTLKAALISPPVLIRPDPEKPFVLITDWQPEAISAILAQVGPSGLESVVEYASKSVPACKRNYAAQTSECYAALWGISHFRAYLYGRRFTMVTDHEPLLALKKWKDYSGMIGRWATVLQSMDFDIRHRKHERHGNADGLTRLHRPEKVPKNEEVIPWNEPKQEVTWTGTSEHPTWIENPELLIIQAWRTNEEEDLLGFLFGWVRPGRRHLIAQELIAPIVQLADDLSPDIYFQSDNSPAPYIFEQSLDPYLQWSACLEEPRDEDTLTSRHEYLKPYEIIPHAFYPRAEEVVIDDDDDEETSEEGSYSEHSEGELSEEEEEEEEAGSEWEALPEEATRTGTEAEDPEAARRREEIATRKRQLEFAIQASLRIGNDPTRDPEPPNPEDGDPAAATSSTARRRRSRSPSSPSPTRPPVRPRTNAGNRPSSLIVVPPTP
ncbi:hypothetical protein CBR_g4754 [Chara braunii]|uniref:Reverse transcriptase domain-containing protein n=1 Tax=Chara braunii TaxID=69332 RepID=A0A388KIT4_CHABU|nr:hypothetical protein CBR_g4754 [Chara braunii]|eukprot:GBG69928.1 hypothetical protein CBR_g4754 [Chara braunii]